MATSVKGYFWAFFSYFLVFFAELRNGLRQSLSLRTSAHTLWLSISLQLSGLNKGHSGYFFDISIP
jgi:hypothetical protein